MPRRNSTARRMADDISLMVWSTAQIESVDITFADAEAIVNGKKAQNTTAKDVKTILGLKHAWQHLLDHYDEPLSFETYRTYNKLLNQGLISNPGKTRTPEDNVYVAMPNGTPYWPSPDVSVEAFDRIVGTATETTEYADESAAMLFGLLARQQFFCDGNKRSAQMLANHYLAQRDAGCALQFTPETRSEALDLLCNFYQDRCSLDDFVWDMTTTYVPQLEARRREPRNVPSTSASPSMRMSP